MKTIKNTLIKGTFILVTIGLINKVLGFGFRIFLSKTLGAENLGIYQLIFPVQGICFAFCSAGLQTAISQITAKLSSKKNPLEQKNALLSGMLLSLSISVIFATVLYIYARELSLYLLNEKRCMMLIRVLALSLPFSSIHSCISGFYYGRENAKIPAQSMLLEQIVRVTTTIFIWLSVSGMHKHFEPYHAVIGILSGEISSALFCFISLKNIKNKIFRLPDSGTFKLLAVTSFPLTCNKVIPGLFQGVETVLLPVQIAASGLSMSDSLKIYGIITGIALPFIMFPATITNSMSVLLLPAIAKADAEKKASTIIRTTALSLLISICLGVMFTLFFLLGGNAIGKMIFNNSESGVYLTQLAWVCPFLYINTTMTSILNGLGHINKTFIYNLISITIRILILLIAVPIYGVVAYICSILASQAILFILHLIAVISTICTFLPASQSVRHHQNS